MKFTQVLESGTRSYKQQLHVVGRLCLVGLFWNMTREYESEQGGNSIVTKMPYEVLCEYF